MVSETGETSGISGVVSPDPLRIGHHFGYFFRYVFFRFGNEDAVPIALAHLPAVKPRETGASVSMPSGIGKISELYMKLNPSDFPG